VARGLGSQSRRGLLGVGWLEADAAACELKTHTHSARLSARSCLCALGGGYGGDDSLALGVSAVASVRLR
jgi:hypothetical protein